MTWNYQIFKFTNKMWDGDELAPERKGAPIYGLFEVYRNEDGAIWGRTQTPELAWDSAFEDEQDPVKAFSSMLDAMKNDLQYPVLDDETMVYAEPKHEKDGLCVVCDVELEEQGPLCSKCNADVDRQMEEAKGDTNG